MDNQATLLIVEDDLDIAEMLSAYFRVQGYDVVCANWGEDALPACQAHHPDLVILDIRLPDIDGYEVARRLRANRRFTHLPIIFLTERRSRTDRLHGLALGADDFISKPFDVQELRLRVQNVLRRSQQSALNNPVTGLPEVALLDEKLAEILPLDSWGILRISLGNLSNFRDTYGFVAADDVLRAVAILIRTVLRESGRPDDFVGHLTPTDLLILTSHSACLTLKDRLRSRLTQSLDFFYPLNDRLPPAASTNRLSFSVQEVLPQHGPFQSSSQIKTWLSL